MNPCSSQIGKIPVVIWALPQVAKQTLLAPDREGSPHPYVAFCLPHGLHGDQVILAILQRNVARASWRE